MPDAYWTSVLNDIKAKKAAKATRRVSQKGKLTKKKRRSLNKKRRGFAKDDRQWRLRVLRRDNYTCQDCPIERRVRRKKGLHAHHKKPKSERPDLRLQVQNGVTLCRDCHNIRHDGLLDYYTDQQFLREIVKNGRN